MSTKEEQIKKKLAGDPGNPVFAEFAEYLRKKKKLDEAFSVCFEGLTHNPSYAAGRLVLARLFYQSNWIPFAVRELEMLHQECSDNAALVSLLKKLNPDFVPSSAHHEAVKTTEAETMIAETTFDLGELNLLDD